MKTFKQRLTAPKKGDEWYSTKNAEAGSKWDMFDVHYKDKTDKKGAKGNCTQYSRGRISELSNKEIKMPFLNVVTKDGKNWYDNAPKELKKGMTPKLGAIIIWAHTTKSNGHVGNVEDIYPNGDILVSMSGFASYLFKTRILTKKSGYVYSDYKLLGFIYPIIEYKQSKTFIVESPRYVRKGAGTEFDIKKVKELTKNGQANCVNKNKNANAQYKKGTRFSVKDIIKASNGSYWALTPSGYVCIQSSKGKIYCHAV